MTLYTTNLQPVGKRMEKFERNQQKNVGTAANKWNHITLGNEGEKNLEGIKDDQTRQQFLDLTHILWTRT